MRISSLETGADYSNTFSVAFELFTCSNAVKITELEIVELPFRVANLLDDFTDDVPRFCSNALYPSKRILNPYDHVCFWTGTQLIQQKFSTVINRGKLDQHQVRRRKSISTD